jgi:hypothetical protein
VVVRLLGNAPGDLFEYVIDANLTGLAVTSFFLVQAPARFIRADTLLTNTSINWQRIFGVFQSGNAE